MNHGSLKNVSYSETVCHCDGFNTVTLSATLSSNSSSQFGRPAKLVGLLGMSFAGVWLVRAMVHTGNGTPHLCYSSWQVDVNVYNNKIKKQKPTMPQTQTANASCCSNDQVNNCNKFLKKKRKLTWMPERFGCQMLVTGVPKANPILNSGLTHSCSEKETVRSQLPKSCPWTACRSIRTPRRTASPVTTRTRHGAPPEALALHN